MAHAGKPKQSLDRGTPSVLDLRGYKPKSIRAFDDSDCSSVEAEHGPPCAEGSDKADRVATGTQLLPRRVPSHLFMISILEQHCAAYAQDETTGRQLFKLISEHLIKMGVVSPMTVMDEMGSMRAQYRYFMHNVMKAAMMKITLGNLKALPSAGQPSEDIVRLETQHYSLMSSEELTQMQTSRYQSEFTEISKIGKGGFGTVYKAKHKLDGTDYAIKKIRFKQSKPEIWLKVQREVKALAALKHSNIVGYNGAWLEHQTRDSGGSRNVDESQKDEAHGAAGGSDSEDNILFLSNDVGFSSRSPCKLQDLSDEDSSDSDSCEACAKLRADDSKKNHALQQMNGFSRKPPTHICRKRLAATTNFTENSRTFSSSQNSLARGSTYASAIFGRTDMNMIWNRSLVMRRSISCDPAISGELSAVKSSDDSYEYSDINIDCKIHVCLFIQMHLCSLTLGQWMRKRNDSCCSLQDFKEKYSRLNLKIFKQILKGVEFIHSQGLIHRDLKPNNIFINEPENHVKIGDFGLAKDDLVSSSDDGFLLTPTPDSTGDFSWPDHTSGVGTSTYASPEQLDGHAYNNKCDIYSLGVLLYEISKKFDTDMEKFRHIGRLRDGLEEDQEFIACWPTQASVVQKMTAKFPHHRPTAKELLQSELFLTKDQVIAQMQRALEQKDEENLHLKEENIHLKRLLEEKERHLRKLQSEADRPLPYISPNILFTPGQL